MYGRRWLCSARRRRLKALRLVWFKPTERADFQFKNAFSAFEMSSRVFAMPGYTLDMTTSQKLRSQPRQTFYLCVILCEIICTVFIDDNK